MKKEFIKSTAIKAGAQELGTDLYGGTFIGAIREDFLHDFAELIVNECYNQLFDMDTASNGMHNYYKHAVIRLKEHFN